MISNVCAFAKAQPLKAAAYATAATTVLMIAERMFKHMGALPTIGKGFIADCRQTYTGWAFLASAFSLLGLGAVCAGKFAWSKVSG